MTTTQEGTRSVPQPEQGADPQYDLAQAIQLTLDALRDAANDKHTTAEMREAQRYLYERILNYYVLMRRRKLTASIEFLTPYSDGKRGATTSGWYYRGTGAMNWVGPFASPRLATEARDADKPRTRVALAFATLDQMALEEEETASQ